MKRIKIPRYIQWLFIIGVIFLVLMSALRLAEVLAFPRPSIDAGRSLGKAFWLGLRYDARMVGIVTLVFFLISLIKPLNPFQTKVGKVFAFFLWFIVCFWFVLFYVTDFAYYSYLGSRLNGSILSYLKEGWTSFGMVMETYPVFWLLVALIGGPILLHWIIRLVYRKVKTCKDQPTKSQRISLGIVFFLLLGISIFGRLGQFPLRWSDAFTLGSDYASNMALNPYQSFFSTLKHADVSFDKQKVKQYYPAVSQFLAVKNPDAEKLNYDRIVTPDTIGTRPNVVIVICESFSYVKSSMSGNALNPTPYFNQMTKDGILFTRCFSPSVGTARGVWAVLTGLTDVERNSTSSRNPNAVNQHLIVNAFKGYDKSYFIGGSLSWANIRGFLENNIPGLVTYEQSDYSGPKINVWGVSDKDVFEKANATFSQEKKPFIAYIQTADNHRPYTIPTEDKDSFKLVNYSQQQVLENGFTSLEEVNAFRYTDYCFEHFIEAAKKEAYFKNTIFVFVGDHGTKGDASKYYSDAWDNGSLVNMHVPLLFYAPDLLKPQQINTYASQLDLMPTVAGLAKINYKNTTFGRDLLSPDIFNNPDRNASFIYDPNLFTLGIIKDSLYYVYDLDGKNPAKVFSMTDNHKITLTDSVNHYYHNLTDAIFQTTKYMILNNKEK